MGATCRVRSKTLNFLVLSCIAIGIDLSLHWLEKTRFVEMYGLSRIIRWEVEAMAYALASVDCVLFLWGLIEPLIHSVVEMVRHG